MAENRQNALIVLHPFGGYTKGQVITDPAAISGIKQGGQLAFVVATQILVTQSASSSAKREPSA